jgi:uncharacterized protein (TIGR02452 family)
MTLRNCPVSATFRVKGALVSATFSVNQIAVSLAVVQQNMTSPSSPTNTKTSRQLLRSIAESTMDTLISGSYVVDSKRRDLHIEASKKGTEYYAPNSSLSEWNSYSPKSTPPFERTDISFLELSTLQGIRHMVCCMREHDKTGVLDFASAVRPGGAFMNGALARSSTLSATLLTESAQRFYNMHKRNHDDFFYTHGMIYSPQIHIFRDDLGKWTKPLVVDVITSAAVNAAEVRAHARMGESTTREIEETMRERMARILYLFERKGMKVLVLGSFGTDAFDDEVSVVARIWAELLFAPGARFKYSFDRVLFAIADKRTLNAFKDAFIKMRPKKPKAAPPFRPLLEMLR